VPTLNRNDVHAFEVAVPPTKQEQTAIAEALVDVDRQISALEARRDKTLVIKQAMMQELLTGRIRLV
jgi:type I restriction enzyme S subunit